MDINNWNDFQKQTEKRNRQIHKEYLKGDLTMEALGQKYNISKARVSKIIKNEKKRAEVNTIDKE